MSKKFIYVNVDGDYEESVGAYEEVDFIDSSAGAGDAGKPIKLDAGGKIDGSMIDSSDVDHDLTTNYDINEHRIINDSGAALTELWSANKIDSEVSRIDELLDTSLSPTGFENQTDSEISFVNGTRTFTIQPKAPATEFNFYDRDGSGQIQKNTVSSAQNLVISDVDGTHFIYFDGNTLFETTTFTSDIINGNFAYVAAVYWNVAQQEGFLGEERHGLVMSPETHSYLHNTIGTAYDSGLGIGGFTLDTDSDAAVTVSIADGVIRDEDIRIDIAHSATPTERFEQNLTDPAQLKVVYKDGSSGIWRADAATDFPFKNTASGRINYNENPGGGWTQTEATDGSFVDVWIFGTNFIDSPVIAIQGQSEYADLITASASTADSLVALVSSGLPSTEFKLLYRLIYETDDTFTTGSRKAKLQEVIDLRASGLGGTTSISAVTDHGNLSGLTDPDHPATAITVSTASFNGLLGPTDTLVQSALDTLDDHTHDDRYYTETELDAGQLDNRYYTEVELDAGQLDNRYYTETELDAGQLDNRYFTESEHINSSTGVADAGKPIILDAGGKLDGSFFDQTDIDHGSISGLGDDDHTQYILVDGTRAFTGDQSMGSNKITNMAPGTAGTDAVNLDQLQAVQNGLDWKESVRLLSDTNIDIATGGLLTVDSVLTVAGDRVLLVGQSTASENGIYIADSGAWVRSEDANASAEVTAGLVTSVTEGTVYEKQTWKLITPDTIVLDTTALSFELMPVNTFSASLGVELVGSNFQADLLASGGIKLVGNELAVEPADFAGNGLQDDGADNLEINFSTAFNDNLPIAAQDLNSNANGEGASIIGIEDAAGNFTATDVEGALAEISDLIDDNGVLYTVGTGGVTKGDLVFVDANNTVLPLDINNGDFGIGLALEDKAAAAEVKILANDVILEGVLTGATAGTKYYWNGTTLVSSLPASAGVYVWLVGVAKNATDLHVNVEFIKRNSL